VLLILVADVIRQRGGPNSFTDFVEAAAERLATQVRSESETADRQHRWDSLMEWFEGTLTSRSTRMAAGESELTSVRSMPYHTGSPRCAGCSSEH